MIISYASTTLEWFVVTHLYSFDKFVINTTAKNLIQRYFGISKNVIGNNSDYDKLFLNLVLEMF